VTGPVLRPMTSSDLPAVLELEHALFGEEAWSPQMLAGELAQQPASRCYLVALDGQAIAGYAGLLAAGRQADVLTLAVTTDRWGRGIGSALLEALLAEAVQRGCTEVFLEVRADNPRAQALYLRYGFEQMGVRKGYYQPSGTDALVMRRDLLLPLPDRHWPAGRHAAAPGPGASGEGTGPAGSGRGEAGQAGGPW
jgi:ribosomal-protein-alanine N-acetyltransferase